jgi:hypothetical protein
MKEVCAHTDQISVDSQQNISNYFSLSWDKPITQCHKCDTLSENKKWESVACASIKKVESAKCEKLEESLAIWMGQLNDKSGKSTDEVIKERVRWLQSTLHYTPNTFLLHN